MTLVSKPQVQSWDPVSKLLMAAYACDGCGFLSIGIAVVLEDGWTAPQPLEYLNDPGPDKWLPVSASGKDFPDVPNHIAAAASEAYECLSIGALRGAVSLARSVIEATAKDKGITDGSLFDKIDKMHEAGLIRPHVKDAAHEVRHFGNDMAHGDFVEPVDRDEAEEDLELMSGVLNEVYQGPKQVERVKAARLAKKAARKAAQAELSVGDQP